MKTVELMKDLERKEERLKSQLKQSTKLLSRISPSTEEQRAKFKVIQEHLLKIEAEINRLVKSLVEVLAKMDSLDDERIKKEELDFMSHGQIDEPAQLNKLIDLSNQLKNLVQT